MNSKKVLRKGLTIAIITTACALLSAHTYAYDWNVKVEGSSTRTINAPSICKSGKIRVEGASTAHFKGVKCDKLTVHIEGSSTVSFTGTYIKTLNGVLEGASTLHIPAGFVRHDNLEVKGMSTYSVN
jgi:hypothetical protein